MFTLWLQSGWRYWNLAGTDISLQSSHSISLQLPLPAHTCSKNIIFINKIMTLLSTRNQIFTVMVLEIAVFH